ncbi:MAG: hypothetical protein QM757_45730 [Paludibaculum sp.]
MIKTSLWIIGLALLSPAAFAQNPNAPCMAILPTPAQDSVSDTARAMLRSELAARGVDAVFAPGVQEAREMGCNVALTLTLKRKDRPGLGSILRSAVPATVPQPAAYDGTPARLGVAGAGGRPQSSRTKDEIRLEVRATPLTLGESVVRRTFSAKAERDGEELLPSLIRQAAAVAW